MNGNIPNNSTAKSVFELWKLGVPLDRAPDEFGATRRLSKIRRDARSNALASAELGKANFRKIGKDADAIYDALGAVHAYVAETGQVRIAKEARLFERLRSGDLVAFGFPVHDRNATEPERVPMFLLRRDFAKWRPCSFVGLDRHFTDVTISEAGVSLEAASAAPAKIEHQRRGPKRIGPMVAAAIDYLRSKDRLFDGRSQEKQINEVRAEVARQNPGRYPNNSQPGHTTVWNYLTGRKPMH